MGMKSGSGLLGFKSIFGGRNTKSAPAFQAWLEGLRTPIWSGRDYKQFAEEGYRRNVIAFRSISMIAEAAASVNLKLYHDSGTAKLEVKKHPVLQLLKKPNPYQSVEHLLESMYSYRLISGNSYLLAVGGQTPVELYSLRPDKVNVVLSDDGLITAYRYKVGDNWRDYPVDALHGRSNILHFRTFNPLHEWYGLSPIEAAAYSIDQHNQSGAWNQALLQNGARPSGALVVRAEGGYQGSLSEDQYSRLKNQIDEQFSGAQNAGRPILLEGGLDWKEMSISPQDMDFINAKHSSARDIALAFGVPPQLLGIPGDNTYSNYSEARLAFWEETVIPLVQSFAQSLNNWLLPMFGANLELLPDLDNLSALSPRREELWRRVGSAAFLSDDEKRSLLGLS